MSKKLFSTLAATLLLSSQVVFAEENGDASVATANAAYDKSEVADAIKLYEAASNSQNISEIQKAYCLRRLAECQFDSIKYADCMKTYENAVQCCDEQISKDPNNIDAYIQKSKILRSWTNTLKLLDSYESYLNDAVKTCDEGLSRAPTDESKSYLLREKAEVYLQIRSDKSLNSVIDCLAAASTIRSDVFDSIVLVMVYNYLGNRALVHSRKEAKRFASLAEQSAERTIDIKLTDPKLINKKAFYYSQLANLLSKLKRESESKRFFELAFKSINAGLLANPTNQNLNLTKAYIVSDSIQSEARRKPLNISKIEELIKTSDECFEKALSTCPNSVEITYPYACNLLSQGQFYKKQKDPARAKKYFDKASAMTQNYASYIQKPSTLAAALDFIIYKETYNKYGYESILKQHPEISPFKGYTETRFELPKRKMPDSPKFNGRLFRVPGGILINKNNTAFGYKYVRLNYRNRDRKRLFNAVSKIKECWLPFSSAKI